MISCRTLTEKDCAAWDTFVAGHPEGSPFHLLAWRDVIESNFGYAAQYQLAMEEGRIVAVLPLFVVDNFITKRVLISTPFAVYGGVLADCDAARAALTAHAETLAADLSVQYLELRNGSDSQRAGFSPVTRYATFTKACTPWDADGVLKALPSKTRNMVRKAMKNPYSARMAENLDSFYRLLLETYRRHGTPVFPLRFFQSIVAKFGPMVDVREILLDGQVMAVSMNFLFRGQMHTYYAASCQEHWALAPNTYMYFDHILWAGRNGYHTFDFGRSKLGTGPYEFKKHWGTVERALPYELKLVRRRTLPNFTPTNPKFAMAMKVWQRIPLAVTRMIGPSIVPLFP